MYAAMSAVDVAQLTYIYNFHIYCIRLTLMTPPCFSQIFTEIQI